MDVEKVLFQLVRVGIVSSIDEKAVTARVTFDDQDDLTTFDLSILVKNTDKNADYWMPDVGEQVLCLFLPVGIQQGWILGSFYDETHTPPASTADKRVIRFKNGTRIENDRASNQLVVDAVGDVTIKATGTVTINAPETIITGNATVKGVLTYLNGMKGSSERGAAAVLQGDVNVRGGELAVDGIGVKAHHHKAQGSTSDTTTAKA